MKFINKSEFRYIIFTAVFGFFYFLYILPWLLSNGIENSSPLIQFLFFTFGLYLLYFFMFKSWSLGTGKSFIASIIGILPFIAFDLIMPEYHINLLTGVLEKGATLGTASSDYLIGNLYQSLGLSGWILVPLVYFVSVIILLIIVAILKNNFVGEI